MSTYETAAADTTCTCHEESVFSRYGYEYECDACHFGTAVLDENELDEDLF